MKRKSLFAMAMLFTGLAQLSTAQRPPVALARNQPILDEKGQIEAAQRAMSSASSTIKGKEFPKRPESPAAKGKSFCEPYDTRTQQTRAELAVELPKGTKKSHQEAFSATYSPDPGIWVMSSSERIEQNRIGPVSVTVDAFPGGFHLITSSQFQSEYSSMKNYVLSLNIPDKVKVDLTVKLEDYVKNYSSYSMEIGVNKGTLVHKAVLSGAGAFNGRTAYHGFFKTVEVCAPPEVTDLAGLHARLKGWVDGVVKKLPVIVRSNTNASTK